MACLTDDAVLAFADGRLAAPERGPVEQHLDGCESCRVLVAEAARMVHAAEAPAPPPAPGPATAPVLAPGAKVARYEIVRPLGAGSGGVVYEAFDPELARKVSLKLLRHAWEPREARTMARLKHPNVVSVYDVGALDGGGFIVMEYVDGETLTAWLRRRPRRWREILEILVLAGRGLAAAHAARLVHQDFKPDNVLVGSDGIPRVADFGLARPLDHPEMVEPAGTRAFMAPEQRGARPPDPRTDQFSFCVALFWALHGRHPFRRVPLPGTGHPPAIDRVPAWLDDVLRRGLSLDPARRYRSMDELLAALSGPAGLGGGRPRRASAYAATALAAAGVAGALWLARDGTSPERPRPSPTALLQTCDDPHTPEPRPWVRPCVQFHEEPLDWEAASQFCLASGTTLATCIQRLECDRLAAAVPPDRPAWIGLSDRVARGVFAWVTDEGYEPYLGQERWAPGHPAAGASCAAVAPAPVDARAVRPWITEDCGRALPFLCERPPWVVDPATRHAYRLLPAPLPWDEARAACERVGGHLATVGSAAEQAFLEAAFFGRGPGRNNILWLGATDRERPQHFRWVTGEPFAFQHFQPGEPDDRDGQQDCLVLNAGTLRWHDRHCGVRHLGVCERAPP